MYSLLSDYHDWMCDKMRINLPEHRNYTLLLTHLDDKAFIFTHPLDENREIDGKYLRQEFLDEEGLGKDLFWEGDASILEVLVAMSIRIETEITGEIGNDHIERWFWVMIHNLGLDKFRDDRYDERKIDEILDAWLNGDAKKDVFPLKKMTHKTDNFDLWYRMQLYLTENYYV